MTRSGLDRAVMALGAKERHVMEHAVAWQHPTSPLYRNHFAASDDHNDWATLQDLCLRGLMYVRVNPGSGTFGVLTIFAVTEAGIAALKAAK